MGISSVLVVMALLIIIEGCFILFMPKRARKFMNSIKQGQWRVIGIIELIVGILLLAVAFLSLAA